MTSRKGFSVQCYAQHTPVLLNKLIELVDPKSGDVVLDCTVGLGGHSSTLLNRIGEKGYLIGLDTDKQALSFCKNNLEKSFSTSNFELHHSNYKDTISLLNKIGVKKLDLVLLDLGFSSFQIDTPNRGFSFRLEGPLDMRLNQDSHLNARDFLNQAKPDEIRNVLISYGEIGYKDSQIVTERILHARKLNQLNTTFELRDIINRKELCPLVFQAIRIHVNQELESLQKFLVDIFKFSEPGTKIAIISFHSLEDRIVKSFFKYWSKKCICPKETLICNCEKTNPKRFELITKKAVCPDEAEIKSNPRSRSSKLRIAKIINIK